jgi:hypothetical protein
MLIAFAAVILGHWANNEPTISQKVLVEMVFAVFFIAFLEGIPDAQPIARGLAWLFLAAVLLGNKSILTGLSKATGKA